MAKRDSKGYGNIFLGLIRTFEVTIISIVQFFITCLVSEILMDKDTRHLPSWILMSQQGISSAIVSQQGKILFLMKHLANMV